MILFKDLFLIMTVSPKALKNIDGFNSDQPQQTFAGVGAKESGLGRARSIFSFKKIGPGIGGRDDHRSRSSRHPRPDRRKIAALIRNRIHRHLSDQESPLRLDDNMCSLRTASNMSFTSRLIHFSKAVS
jgi:hypothetical protein